MESEKLDTVRADAGRAKAWAAGGDAADPVFAAAIEEYKAEALAVRRLFIEIDCRIKNGANSNGHLEFVREKLDRMFTPVKKEVK